MRSTFERGQRRAMIDGGDAIEMARREHAARRQGVESLPEKTYTVMAFQLPALEKWLAGRNKHTTKTGAFPLTLEVLGSGYAKRDGASVKYYTVRLVGDVPVYDGWHFVAWLDHRGESGTIINRTSSGKTQAVTDDELLRYKERGPVCDDCGTLRDRHSTYVVWHEDKGTNQVGSSCLEAFLGRKADAAMFYFNLNQSFEERIKENSNALVPTQHIAWPIDTTSIVDTTIARSAEEMRRAVEFWREHILPEETEDVDTNNVNVLVRENRATLGDSEHLNRLITRYRVHLARSKFGNLEDSQALVVGLLKKSGIADVSTRGDDTITLSATELLDALIDGRLDNCLSTLREAAALRNAEHAAPSQPLPKTTEVLPHGETTVGLRVLETEEWCGNYGEMMTVIAQDNDGHVYEFYVKPAMFKRYHEGSRHMVTLNITGVKRRSRYCKFQRNKCRFISAIDIG